MAAITICASARILMHLNDSFFWVVTGFSGMEVATSYRTLAVLMVAMGVVAFIMVSLLGSMLDLT